VIPYSQRINARVLAILILVVTLTGIILGLINQENVRRVHLAQVTEKVLLSNSLTAHTIDSNEVRFFVELMRAQDEAIKQKQLQFFYDREELFSLQAAGASEEQQQEALSRLAGFHAEMNNLKTERYWQTAIELSRLRDINRSTYVYVIADTGLSTSEGERLYTFIFDADDSGADNNPARDGLGTTMVEIDGLAEVIESGKQMEEAEYYRGVYGELFYAYAPILDENGKVIAVLGTDVDLGNMNSDIAQSLLFSNLALLASAIVLIVLIYLYLNSNVIKPIALLTNTAHELAEGKVHTQTPERALKQSGEIGQLAHAVEGMRLAYQGMIKSTHDLYDAAIIGKLDVRNDETEYKGALQMVIKQINATLDATTLYLNSIPESVLIVSRELEVYFENDHFHKHFEGISAIDFLLRVFPVCDLHQPGTHTQLECLQNNITTTLAQEHINKTVWYNESCFSVVFKEMDLDETIDNSILVIIIDITDLTREKENAQAAAEAKSSFLSRMSHEIRTPMNAIIGMTKIAYETNDIDRLKYCLGNIETSSAQLLGIINDVLDISKIEAGKLELEEVPMNLDLTLWKAASILLGAMERKHQELIVSLAEEMELDFLADELRLSQVLTNFLSNANKFTPEKGRITLKAETIARHETTNTVRFSVSDTGIGMNKKQTENLFNAFEQADGSITRRFGGTGLGLAISKSIVEKMGGTIRVESIPGEGATFSFELEMKKALAPSPDGRSWSKRRGVGGEGLAADSEEVDFSELTVLLAEDVDINREIFLVLFEDTMMNVDIAINGVMAVEKFTVEPERYDLIIMDIQMPEMDGYEATRIIRAMEHPRAKSIPIIAMTANAFKEDVERCLESGMNDHLAKPIDKDVVIEKIIKHTKGSIANS